MTLQLPRPIELFVEAENSGDIEALSECFAPTATVRDESHLYEGITAIKEWKAETKRKYNHTVAPLEVSSSYGQTVLKAKLSGNFFGQPSYP